MKIEIEFNSTIEAKVTIDGKPLKFGVREGCLGGYHGTMTKLEQDQTIGGIIARKLSSPLVDILQNWMPDEDDNNMEPWGTWQKLPRQLAEEVEDAMDSI